MNQEIDRIIIPTTIVEEAVDTFKDGLPLEIAVFVFGRVLNRRVVATDILIPENGDYLKRFPHHCEVSYQFLARKVHKFWDEGKDLILSWHSHPINGLSRTDVRNHRRMMEVFPYHVSGFYNHGTIGFYRYRDGVLEELEHRTVDMAEYERQSKIINEEKQMLLASTTVALVGCGGGNSEVARMLAEKGVGKLILIDPDGWDETNLNRVWIPRSHLWRNKALSMSEILRGYRPNVEVEAYPCRIEGLSEEVLRDADIVVTFTDTLSSRLYVNQLVVNLGKPAVFAASEIRAEDGEEIDVMVGDCLVYIPGETPCYRCNLALDHDQLRRETEDPQMWRLYANRYGLPEELPPAQSIVELNSVIASIVSDEVTKLITGYSEPVHHQYWDHLNRDFIVIKAGRNPECTACREVPEVETETNDIITLREVLGESK